MKSKKRAVLVIITAILAVLIYLSPQDPWVEPNILDAIRVGRLAAIYMFEGNPALESLASEWGKEKLEGTGFQDLAQGEMFYKLKDKFLLSYIMNLLIWTQSDDFKLVALVRKDNVAIITFGIEDDFKGVVEIPGLGKALFSLALRFSYDADRAWYGKLGRKIANLPVILGKDTPLWFGTTARWRLLDYALNLTQADVFEWAMKEGEAFSRKKAEETEIWGKGLSFEYVEALWREVDAEIVLDNLWATEQARQQLANAEQLLSGAVDPFPDVRDEALFNYLAAKGVDEDKIYEILRVLGRGKK